MIPSYSPQARGRFGHATSPPGMDDSAQDAAITRESEHWKSANEFLRAHYIAEFNRRFTVPAAQRGTASIILPALGTWS